MKKPTVAELTKRVEILEATVRVRDTTILNWQEQAKLLRRQSSEKDRQVLRLQLRLDAALYAMVLMQGQLQTMVTKEDEERERKFQHDAVAGWKEVALAT